MEAEFLSLIELQAYVPEHVPNPYAWGRLELSTHTQGWFLLIQFVDFFEDQPPDPVDTGACVAKLHRSSQLGRRDFGFRAPTYDGMLTNGIALENDWITCFTKMLDTSFDHDWTANGPWRELEVALKQVRQVVIPRLLGMLQAEGRRILPSFIHGDLWEGNIGTERSTGKVFIFDSNGYYAHHEMELGMWATEHHNMTSPRSLEEYSKHMQPSEPANEFEDRVRLYSLKNYLMYSANRRLHSTRQRLDLQFLHSNHSRKQLTKAAVL